MHVAAPVVPQVVTYRGGSEQRKVTPRNNGKLQTFIACFWSHNWIDKASAGKLLHNPVAPQNNFKNAQTILTQRLRQMRGNFGEYKIFIIPSYEFFSKQNILYNTPIITNEVRNIKNLQA